MELTDVSIDAIVALAKQKQTRMWANAQRDGRPAEYRWRLCAQPRKVWLAPTAQVPCSNATKIPERKTWRMQSEFCTWQNSLTGQEPPENVYVVYQPRRRPNTMQSLVGFR